MKRSASQGTSPFEVEDAVTLLGQRVSVVRRAYGITQADLAAKAGVGLSTLRAIEQGSPNVQIGYTLRALWALDILGELVRQIPDLGKEAAAVLMESDLPQRVRGPLPGPSSKGRG